MNLKFWWKKRTESLSTKAQIKVLESIDWDRMEDRYEGLCYTLYQGLKKYRKTIETGRYSALVDYFPLFTNQNAQRFGASTSPYWWGLDSFGYTKRKEFVNWMISELKKTKWYRKG